MTVKEEFKNFCKRTSMKGVPRIFSSEKLGLKVTWLLAVKVLFIVSLSQSYNLLVEFFLHPYVTMMEENVLSIPEDKNEHLPLPSLTLCNLNPYSTDAFSSNSSIATLGEYFNLVEKDTACNESCTPTERRLKQEVRARLLNSAGYFQYIGALSARLKGHAEKTLIQACDLINVHGTRRESIPCEDLVQVNKIQFLEYFNCFTLSLDREAVANADKYTLYTGFSLILYLDNFVVSEPPCFNAKKHFGSNGALLTIHAFGTLPRIERDFKFLDPGAYTSISLQIGERIRLTEPYGECIPEDTMYYYVHGLKLPHSQDTCLQVCLTSGYERLCNCSESTFGLQASLHAIEPYEGEELASATAETPPPFCQDMKLGIDHVVRNDQCVSSAFVKVMPECLRQCKLECQSYLYFTESSEVTWPAHHHIPSFYNQFVEKSPFNHRFAECNSTSPTFNLEVCTNTIRRNFLKVDIALSNHRYVLFHDLPKYSTNELLSQLGGALNLWSGITMVIVVEVIELIYHIIANSVCNWKAKLSVTDKSDRKEETNQSAYFNYSISDEVLKSPKSEMPIVQ